MSPSHRPDPATLLGTWDSTDRGDTGGILRLRVTVGGGIGLRAWDADGHDWGTVPAQVYAHTPDAPDAWALTARYDLGDRRTAISAYGKTGILVLTTYTGYRGTDPRAASFTRAFCYPVPDGTTDPAPGGQRRTDPTGPVDPGPLAGTWVNFDPQATGLAGVEVRPDGTGLLVQPRGTGHLLPREWQTAAGPVYRDATGTSSAAAVAFTADFPLSGGSAGIVGYVNRRLLTIECAVRPAGADSSPYFVREHFYAVNPST